ncbi:probable LRR receptor-like serine/threonine-protein kinase At1g53430 isoform X2 [Papaver somniferum]|uniref:probable LRR receptor-like serine/threonine-protein kinase At1g53430 isoform X2 n=1 Tax=Papaver somniferum TaxID=3469 RepID=UPI000E6FEBFE|nr:probable LRR receptor-like serine/threonine-protein kinase At1g53430 isoform X2 [Papaver somniferum]
MENGDLQTALFGDVNLKKSLDWKTRVKICLGIAKGLAFLHFKDQSKPLIIHRYIEPANILLDKNFHPKISGFGGSRLCEGEDTHYTTEVIGTYGYFDPEYFIQGIVNDKTDVYSFGVLILVIFSGKRPIYREKRSESVNLVSFAQELKEKVDLYKLIDEDLNMQYSAEEATMILNLAIMCTSFTGKLRPTMLEVVNILERKTKMKTPRVDPLFSTVVNSEEVISNVKSNSPYKETELTDEGFVSDLDYFSDEIGEASVSSEVAPEVPEENDNIEFIEYGSKHTVRLDETGSLSFRRIEVATKDFSLANKIGQGSTSSVYRGVLPNGKIVAVKQLLMTSDQGKQVFRMK